VFISYRWFSVCLSRTGGLVCLSPTGGLVCVFISYM